MHALHLQEELGRKVHMEYPSGRNRSTVPTMRSTYSGYASANPHAGAGRELFGDSFGIEAKNSVSAHADNAAKHAKTLNAAFAAAAPAAEVNYKSRGHWPARTLAILHAKAKALGQLDDPISVHWPSGAPKEMLRGPGDETVRQALQGAAGIAKHHKLQAAMIFHNKAASPKTKFGQLEKMGDNGHVQSGGVQLRTYSRSVIQAMRHLVAKHPELADMTPAEAGLNIYRGNQMFKLGGTTIGEALAAAGDSS